MRPTTARLIRHPAPPGIDTLSRTTGKGLAAIPDPRHRAMVASVLDAGLVEEAIADTADFDATTVDQPRRTAHMARLTAEFEAFGVVVPAATTRNITLMRALMVPIEDPVVAYAVDRVWVFVTNVDDVCSKNVAEAEALLRAGMLPDARDLAASPYARYVAHMFRELAPHGDPTFLAAFKTLFYSALNGVLMEAEFDPEVSDEADGDYVRLFNGFSQFWFLSLQFTDPSLSAHRHRAFWTAAMSSCVGYLNDVNDVLSFYKEAVDGEDFAISRIHRRAVQEGIPYLTAYRRSLADGRKAYDRVLRLATAEQRPHLDRYMTAFAYWHLHCRRYRWQDVYPGLEMIDA
ncbi:hypothetical protein [Streptomyces sp. NPDC056144]|uniref:hypothetical protein n=1 Tax=unclassified Streptomyces TaxID=2593676 RepID=UPI0035E1CFB8